MKETYNGLILVLKEDKGELEGPEQGGELDNARSSHWESAFLIWTWSPHYAEKCIWLALHIHIQGTYVLLPQRGQMYKKMDHPLGTLMDQTFQG